MASLEHLDTCMACYLQDHHNRDGEFLFGIPVDGARTNEQVRDALRDAFQADGLEDCPVDDDQFDALLEEAFTSMPPLEAFDNSLEVNESDLDWEDPVQAWFLLTWKVEAMA